MSRKIIGVTVGSSLPKPNFKQTDPTKGDYIKNKPDFDGLLKQVEDIGEKVGDTSVSEQINDAVSQKSQVQIIALGDTEILSTLKIHKLTQDEYDQEVINGTVDENALYLTPDEEIDLSGYATEEYVNNAVAEIATPDVSGQIETHNTNLGAHEDIRGAIAKLDNLVGDAEVSSQISIAIAGIVHPVSSINGKTGDVSLTASDVGALPIDTAIPSIIGLATEEYVNNAVAQKSQVQIVTWEDDD